MTHYDAGALSKMTAQLGENGLVHYQLPIGEQTIDMNALIGKTITLDYQGKIGCRNCGRSDRRRGGQQSETDSDSTSGEAEKKTRNAGAPKTPGFH